MENGENSEHQRESSLRRNGKREMEYEAEDEPESLSRKRRLEPEERRRLKIESDRKHRAEMKERMKSDSDAILEDCVMDNQLKDSEKCDTGKKLKKAQGELTGKLKQILEFISHKELNIEESSNLVKIFHDHAYKAEEEGYKIRMEQINECLKENLETVENLRAENKTLLNNLKEMMCKMDEMDPLNMLKIVEAKRLKEETMHVILLNHLESYVQEYRKPPEHNFDGLPNVGGGLLPDFPTSQVRELGANETPNAILDAEASASTTGHSNEENVRLQQQVYELKKDVQALKSQMFEHYKNFEMNGCIHAIAEGQLGH